MDNEEHLAYHRRIIYVFIVIILLLFGGATFYHYSEKWDYIDALYFSAATMTTVGYGDITPKTNTGKIFTIIYVFTGVSIALYGLSLLGSHFVELREEFWMQKLGRIRIKYHSQTFLEKLKNLVIYNPEELTRHHQRSKKNK